MDKISCPFVYRTGKQCTGHIVRVEAYKAEVVWERGTDGKWQFLFSPRSHYHLFCSDKGNHAGSLRSDDSRMKFHWRELSEDIRTIIIATDVGAPPGTNATCPARQVADRSE